MYQFLCQVEFPIVLTYCLRNTALKWSGLVVLFIQDCGFNWSRLGWGLWEILTPVRLTHSLTDQREGERETDERDCCPFCSLEKTYTFLLGQSWVRSKRKADFFKLTCTCRHYLRKVKHWQLTELHFDNGLCLSSHSCVVTWTTDGWNIHPH